MTCFVTILYLMSHDLQVMSFDLLCFRQVMSHDLFVIVLCLMSHDLKLMGHDFFHKKNNES